VGFKKGESGNPAGRPKGTKDRRTELRGLLEPHAEELVAKAVELALAGDVTALRICMDRLIPIAKPTEPEKPQVAIQVNAIADARSRLDAPPLVREVLESFANKQAT